MLGRETSSAHLRSTAPPVMPAKGKQRENEVGGPGSAVTCPLWPVLTTLLQRMILVAIMPDVRPLASILRSLSFRAVSPPARSANSPCDPAD